jgi:hypothetical protein
MWQDPGFSGSFRLRERLLDKFIKLGVYAVERERQDGVVSGEHGDGGLKNPCFQTREQAGDLPAVGCDEVTVAAGWAKDEALESEPAQIVGHLRSGVFADRNAEQVGADQRLAYAEVQRERLLEAASSGGCRDYEN